MDFTFWADWVRALLGATVAYAAIMLVWTLVTKAASFGDQYGRTGRHIIPIPRRMVRPHVDAINSKLHACSDLRQNLGLSTTPHSLQELVEIDRSRLQLAVGRFIWTRIAPSALLIGGAILGIWLLSGQFSAGPLSSLPDLNNALEFAFGSKGWYGHESEDCYSWTYLRGCESMDMPWWGGIESGFLFGISLAFLFCAWKIKRAAAREFNNWGNQYPPVLECLSALASCRDALGPTPSDVSLLDAQISELCTAIKEFSRVGIPGDIDRRTEFEEHSAKVSRVIHDAMGKVLRDGVGALPALVQLLATVQDRLHESRWLVLLDASMLTSSASAGPTLAPIPPAITPSADSGRGQRFVAMATALPTIPALLALGFTAVTISQAADTLKLSQRGQIASDYNDTVDKLGDASINVRTSAIFAIQRIMRDSPLDRPALVKVLASYVRGHAKMPNLKEAQRLRRDEKTRPADDVQAALDVLGAQELFSEEDPIIDLRNTFLVGASLGGGVGFYDADFRGADLTRADLRDGIFENAWFDDARMSESFLGNADFDEATFINADLSHAWWNGAKFESADLTDANLTGADFSDDEEGILDLSGAEMSGADLTEANLTGAYAVGADFSEDSAQDIPAATLTRTNFTNAELRGAQLKGTDQRTAIWEGANLP